MYNDERPGTSFTSKRQVQTEQRKRQLNVGTLETEDKSVKQSRPITQEQQRYKKKPRIPIQMLHDKESLYEEVLQSKLINNKLVRENQGLQTRLKQIEQELQRMMRFQPQDNNLMESYYQDAKPKNNNLAYDLKRQLRKSQEDVRARDQQIQLLLKSSKTMRTKELETELLAYQNETVRLKSLLSVVLGDDSEQTDGQIKQENLQLKSQIQQLNEQIQAQQVKCREFESKSNKYLIEKQKKEKLVQYLEKQIEQIRMRDLDYKKSTKTTDPEYSLKQQLENTQTQLDSYISNLRNREIQLVDLDRKLKDQEKDYQQQIDTLERDRQLLRDTINSMKEESSNQGRRRTVQNVLESRLEVLPEGPEIQENIKKHLPCVQKDDVALVGKEIRFKLRISKIPITDLDKYLFFDQISISIEELLERLQNQPFNLIEEDALKLSRYLVEDSDEKMIEFNIIAESTVPRVRSILRNLIGQFHILSKQEEDQFFNDIATILTKFRLNLEDYLLKFKKKQDVCQIEDLEDALKSTESSLNHHQIDFLMLKNYEFTQNIKHIDFKKIFKYFFLGKTFYQNQEPQQQGARDSQYSEQPIKQEETNLIQQSNYTDRFKDNEVTQNSNSQRKGYEDMQSSRTQLQQPIQKQNLDQQQTVTKLSNPPPPIEKESEVNYDENFDDYKGTAKQSDLQQEEILQQEQQDEQEEQEDNYQDQEPLHDRSKSYEEQNFDEENEDQDHLDSQNKQYDDEFEQ
ncbi:hypothetical protein pb186bvf_005872 [Paramecium bursaria]